MPVRSTQPSSYPGGRALVEVIGPAADRVVEPVEICVVDQMAGPDKATHLDPRTPQTPWKSAIFWFPPTNPRRTPRRLAFDLEHGITFHLRPNVPYVLRLKGGDGVVEERMVWTAIRGRSSPPEWTPPADARWPAEEPAAQTAEEPAPTTAAAATATDETAAAAAESAPEASTPVDPVTVNPQERPPRRQGVPAWIFAVAAVLLLAAGAGAWMMLAPPDSPLEALAPPPPTTLDEARRLIQEQASADQALAEGQRFLAAGSLDGAFLLLRHAAERGSAAAALEVGAMYDPETHSPKTSPMPSPNPDQAAAWYRRAAEAGDAEAQFRLGRVLLSGRTSDPGGPEKAVVWLEKAAAQGHEQAREALPK